MDIKIKLGIIAFFIILIQSGLKLLGVILKIENLTEIIIHSEPIEGRTDGIFF